MVKLSIYWLIYVHILAYGELYELWVITERMRPRIQAAKMSFLCRAAGCTLSDGVRSLVTQEDLRVESLLHLSRGVS